MAFIIGVTLDHFTAGFAIITFMVMVCYKREKDVGEIAVATLAGGMLPLAFGFAVYAFLPGILGSIEDMTLQITVTGLFLMFIYGKTINDKLRRDSS